jgi:hypothetical protein
MIIDEPTRSKLSGTRCVSKSGDLLVLHHSTDATFTSFEKTGDIGFHFGSVEQAEKRRKNRISRLEADDDAPWRTISAVLAVKNPLTIANDPGAWRFRYLSKLFSAYMSEGARKELRELSVQFDREIEQCGTKEPIAVKASFAIIRQELIKAGFDGVVYRNDFESTGRAIEWSWIAFSDSQIIEIPTTSELSIRPLVNVQVGKPINLRGISPKRAPKSNEEGKLERLSDVIKFRRAVEEWATQKNLTPKQNMPLDYEFKLGEYCDPDDLLYEIKLDDGEALTLGVHSKNGRITLAWHRKITDSLILDSFDPIATEDFITNERRNDYRLTWKSAENIDLFIRRLDDGAYSMLNHLHLCKQKVNHKATSQLLFI